MRLKKAILIGSIVSMVLLLCFAMIMDRKMANPPLESVIAADTVTQTNTFIIAQTEAEKPLPHATAVMPSMALPEEVEADEPAEKPNEATFIPVQESIPADGFLLKIGNTKISISYDTSEEALENRPGWLNTSAYPGEEGICIIYGHRNRKHLRALEKAVLGDEIMISTDGENVFTYTISDTYIVNDLSEIALTSTEEPTLVLVTCYPFRYSGSAPQKYVVIAKKEGMTYE